MRSSLLVIALVTFPVLFPAAAEPAPASAPTTGPAASEPDPRSWGLDLKDGFARARAEDRFIVVVILDAKSPACAKFVRETLGLSPMVKALEPFVRIRLDSEKDRGLVLLAKAQKFPTVIFYDPDGNELDRFSGFADLTTMLHRCLEAVDPKTNYVLLKERLRQNPDDIEALYYMGFKYSRRGEIDRAEEYFKRVEELDPKDGQGFLDNILLRRVERLAQKGEPEEALRLLGNFASKYPDSDEMENEEFILGRLLFQSGNMTAARESFRSFLEKYPESERRFEVQAAYQLGSGLAPAPASSAPAR